MAFFKKSSKESSKEQEIGPETKAVTSISKVKDLRTSREKPK